MKSRILTILFCCFTMVIFGQSDFIREIDTLITPEGIDMAESKVNEYLMKNPDNVDALIMRGNIIYYKYTQDQPQIEVLANSNESVYDNTIGFLQDPVVILPVHIADSINAEFFKALKADKKRQDIYYGICHIYSISLQTDKLLDFLPRLKDNVDIDENSPYNFADYARNFIDRDQFDDGMRIYTRISELFPKTGGILSDMASEYYTHGDLEKAREYADKALARKEVDDMTYGNAFFIYAIMEDYESALNALQKKSETEKNKDYLLYRGLLELNQNKDWKPTLTEYLQSDNNDEGGNKLAAYLLHNEFENSMDAYKEINDIQLTDAFKILIHKYYKTRTAEFLPAFNYAEALTYNHRYKDAITAFAEIKTDSLSGEDMDDLNFYYAWALYNNSDTAGAVKKWEMLLTSENFYCKSAAAYFIGKYFLNQGDKEKAREYFLMVSDRASESKYATLCWNMVREE